MVKKIYYEEHSPLTAAAMCSDYPEIIKMLIDCGEDISFRNDMGYTALQCAASCNSNFQVMSILLKNGKEDDFSHIELGNYRESALGLAISQNKNIEIKKN